MLPHRSRLLLAATLLVLIGACRDGVSPENPTPGINALTPNAVEQGSGDVTLSISGSDFVRSSVVRLNGSDRPTQFVSRSEIRATLPAADFVSAGVRTVSVFNPGPGGGTSNPMQFTVLVRTNPAPVVSSVSPAHVAAEATGVSITIHGSGFVPESRVVIGNQQRQTTYVSTTELTAALTDADVAGGGTLAVRVYTPPPGGGTSNPLNLEVRTPVPVLTSLSGTQATAGQPTHKLQVNGTGFVTTSQVRFNGAPRPTQRLSAGVLEATLEEGDLRASGTYTITVSNPAPGGGTSNGLAFEVVNGVPEITLLPSWGASAGRPGFTLMVHGRGFVEGSVVRWNGVARPTQYISGARVAATISAGDVASAGAVQITVHNPSPGGGTSGTETLHVRTVPAATVTSTRTVDLPARDVVYDPHSAKLYASIGGSSPQHPNSVVAIDPATGAVTGSVFVGSEPGALAISDDGRSLHVALDGAGDVRQVALPSLTAGLQFSLNGARVEEMEAMPGHPGTVAIALMNPASSPRHVGVAIYDDGIRRPNATPGHTGSNSIEFGEDAEVIYGYNNESTDFGFRTLRVASSGVQEARSVGGLIGSFYTRIHYASGRVYARTGEVVDASRSLRLGVMGGGTSFTRMTVVVSPALGRAYFLTENSGIEVFDLNTFASLGSLQVTTPANHHPANRRVRLVLWGTDGLAYADETKVVIIRSPLTGP